MGPLAVRLPIGPPIGWEPQPQVSARRDASVSVSITEDHVVAHWGDPAQAGVADGVRPDHALSTPPVLTGRSLLVQERRSGTTVLSPDRFGVFPILVHIDGSRLTVAGRAAEMAGMLGPRARLDPDAVLELLAFGQLLGERSPLRNVRHLAAGQPVRIIGGGDIQPIKVEPGDDGDGAARFDFSRAVDAFVTAVDRRLTQDRGTLLPLSGGLDSRLLLAAARASGHRPEAMCFGMPGSADRAIAESLSDHAGLHLHTGTLSQEAFDAAARDIALNGTAEVPLNHGQVLIPKALNHDCRDRPLMTGTGGEIYRAFYYDRGMPGMSVLGIPQLKTRLLPRAMRYAREALDNSFAAFAAAFPGPAASLAAQREALFRTSAAEAISAADFLDRLYRDMRMRRFVVAGQGLLDGLFHRSHPLLDPEVAATWSTMPTGWRLGSRFHRLAIARLAPDLAEVAWDRTMRPLRQGLHWQERFPGLAARLGQAAIYAKHGERLADYATWLPAPETGPIADLLEQAGLERSAIETGFARLLGGAAATHGRGVLGAVGLWLTQACEAER